LAAKEFSSKRKVTQLHFGGGTPTMLTEAEFDQILGALHDVFLIGTEAEISIEIDPRTVYGDEGKKLRYLHRAGFNRVSFGVQDLDPVVQEAVRRRQSEEMTIETFRMAREIGFSGINIDLIYGLPFQTTERFQKTAKRIAEMQPDRIAFFSYAKIPWMKEHQKAMPEEAEPSVEEKFQIYVDARKIFLSEGYEAIGMDHFSLSSDSLTKAFHQKTLWRNFQGYSLKLAEDLLGFGVTSIGYMDSTYLQNVKTIEEYRREIEAGRLPVLRGFALGDDDHLRRWVIQRLMCHFELDKREFERLFSRPFDTYFSAERAALQALKEEGMLEESSEKLLPTELGCLFIRLIASAFDAYLKPEDRFSKSI
jgi:oxygen-independent coproporphyrinogen-3 oxidase